jgi:hypothetical protein
LVAADLVLDEDQLKSYALEEIERLLQSHGKDTKEDYPTMPRSDVSLINESHNRLIFDEMNNNCRLHLMLYRYLHVGRKYPCCHALCASDCCL